MEAYLYESLEDGKVKCHLCSHRCVIKAGRRGKCSVRENQAGTLHTLVYGKVIARHVDPIEKKPLFHFLPSTTAFSIATAGCNLRCKFCQNWQISQASPLETINTNYTPEQVMKMLQAAGVGAGVVANARDLDEDAQLNHYHYYRELDHPYMGRLRYYHPVGIKLSGVETEVRRPVLLGEHTDYICTDILGMPQDEVDRLRQKGVFD